ncbi:MAG: uroporphyrinogen-III synthase [bacterium]
MNPSGSGPVPASGGAGAAGRPPLHGLTFLNTREASAAPELTRRLAALGAEVLERPMLRFVPPLSWQAFDSRFAGLAAGDWVAFTSATAVRFALKRLTKLGATAEALRAARLVAVGPATAAALEAEGLAVALVPETFQAEGLLKTLLARIQPGGRVWLPRAEKGRELLADGLERAGLNVAVTPVYRTLMPEGGLGPAGEALAAGRLDWIVFTSSSTVNHFMALLGREGLAIGKARVACLGEVTARTARALGVEPDVTPRRQELDGLVEAIVAWVAGNGPAHDGPTQTGDGS